jgi:hypothetical protein
MGYVEKAGEQLEAIILQENEVQVVHIGDLISGRYRVTKIAPDSVEAIDETLVQSPMTKPNGAESKELTAGLSNRPLTPPVAVSEAQPEVLAVAAKSDHSANAQGREAVTVAPPVVAQAQPTTPSGDVKEDRIAPTQSTEPDGTPLGIVQKADGKVEAVVADGDTVQLVPETSTLAQAAPPSHSQEGTPTAQGSTAPVGSNGGRSGLSRPSPGSSSDFSDSAGVVPSTSPCSGCCRRVGTQPARWGLSWRIGRDKECCKQPACLPVHGEAVRVDRLSDPTPRLDETPRVRRERRWRIRRNSL